MGHSVVREQALDDGDEEVQLVQPWQSYYYY